MVFQSSQGLGEKHWLNTAHSVCMADHAAVRKKKTRLGKEEEEEEEKEEGWNGEGRADFMVNIKGRSGQTTLF